VLKKKQQEFVYMSMYLPQSICALKWVDVEFKIDTWVSKQDPRQDKNNTSTRDGWMKIQLPIFIDSLLETKRKKTQT